MNHAGLQDHFKTLAFVEMRWKQEKIKLCSDPRYILKVEPTRSADRFNTGKDKRVRSNSKMWPEPQGKDGLAISGDET